MFKKTAVLAVALMMAATTAEAQMCTANSAAGCSINTTARVTVPAMVELMVSGAGNVALTAPTMFDLGTGYVQDAGPAISVRSNRAWTLSVHTTAATNWTYAGTESGVKPISDLTWSNTATGTYSAITTSAAAIVSNQARTNAGAPTVFFRTLYSADLSAASNAAGDYSIPLVFTLTAP
ncbi:MAG TPA: hypothetical protein VFO52_01440 [Longimicrobiales bacterium]|nr:hypothetical protein [Longimicrobiales bacterium]